MSFIEAYAAAELQHRNLGYSNPTPTSFDVRAILRRDGQALDRRDVIAQAKALGLRLSDF